MDTQELYQAQGSWVPLVTQPHILTLQVHVNMIWGLRHLDSQKELNFDPLLKLVKISYLNPTKKQGHSIISGLGLSPRKMRLLSLEGVNTTLRHRVLGAWCSLEEKNKVFQHLEVQSMQWVFQVSLGGNFILVFKPISSSASASHSHCCFERALWVTSHIFQNLTLKSCWKCKLSSQASKALWRFYLRCLLYNSMTPHKTYFYLQSRGIAFTESLLNQSRMPFPIFFVNHGSLSIMQNVIY